MKPRPFIRRLMARDRVVEPGPELDTLVAEDVGETLSDPLLCPRCGTEMGDLGLGRYVCPNGHGEWLAGDELEEYEEVDSDPYRQEKTIASQLREYGTNADRAGRSKDRKTVYRRPWEIT